MSAVLFLLLSRVSYPGEKHRNGGKYTPSRESKRPFGFRGLLGGYIASAFALSLFLSRSDLCVVAQPPPYNAPTHVLERSCSRRDCSKRSVLIGGRVRGKRHVRVRASRICMGRQGGNGKRKTNKRVRKAGSSPFKDRRADGIGEI